ncbi:hypothetical protein [Aerococcus tenax]|uniref:hypothetical protein n=1 Tax=Aerococcus tenax TaxID=3078812 RepID=UPI0018A7434C|nr:hypothetical protein [Aerococcus tenax]
MNLDQLQAVEDVRSTLKDSEVLSDILLEYLQFLVNEVDGIAHIPAKEVPQIEKDKFIVSCVGVMGRLFDLNKMVNENLFDSLTALDEVIEAEQDRLELEAEMADAQEDEAPADIEEAEKDY